jgi:rare lipoprotein A
MIIAAAIASWYGYECASKPMANGKPFHPYAMTAASWCYPLGSRVTVHHGGRSVTVTITDRGPARRLVRRGRVIDLSLGAFMKLSDPSVGLIHVELKPKPNEQN